MDLIIPNIDLSNYYTKTEIDDLDNELSTLILNTYTKTEIDTLLFNSSSQAFSAISLINLELELNYKTAAQLAETYYNKTEVDNLITFDPTVVYTKTEINSILNNNYSSIEDRDQLFLAYSSTNQINEAYYDKTETNNLLANKVSTTGTGDVAISGNLDVGVGASATSIKAYSNHLGNASFIELESQWRDQGFLNFGTNYSGAAYLFLTVKDYL